MPISVGEVDVLDIDAFSLALRDHSQRVSVTLDISIWIPQIFAVRGNRNELLDQGALALIIFQNLRPLHRREVLVSEEFLKDRSGELQFVTALFIGRGVIAELILGQDSSVGSRGEVSTDFVANIRSRAATEEKDRDCGRSGDVGNSEVHSLILSETRS